MKLAHVLPVVALGAAACVPSGPAPGTGVASDVAADEVVPLTAAGREAARLCADGATMEAGSADAAMNRLMSTTPHVAWATGLAGAVSSDVESAVEGDFLGLECLSYAMDEQTFWLEAEGGCVVQVPMGEGTSPEVLFEVEGAMGADSPTPAESLFTFDDFWYSSWDEFVELDGSVSYVFEEGDSLLETQLVYALSDSVSSFLVTDGALAGTQGQVRETLADEPLFEPDSPDASWFGVREATLWSAADGVPLGSACEATEGGSQMRRAVQGQRLWEFVQDDDPDCYRVYVDGLPQGEPWCRE